MKVLIPDTSVLIDLERGSLLEESFRLPFDFVVPDLLYEQELKDHGGPELIKLGLTVAELAADLVTLAFSYRRRRRSLSLPDGFALALAKTNSWILLTGDRELRVLAEEEGVACHGILWLLDLMFDAQIIPGDKLSAGLGKIAGHHRCRLPKQEVRQRLRIYSGR